MKKIIAITAALLVTIGCLSAQDYVPSESNLKARQEFSQNRLGIFLHWGIYSMYGQGEWYLNNGSP